MVDATILDGAAIVQILSRVAENTFQEYVNRDFAPYISTQLEKVHRLDLVWDVYLLDSLKGTTRQNRGKGVRKRVAPSTVMPKNWKDFLCVDQNKTELFGFLAIKCMQHVEDDMQNGMREVAIRTVNTDVVVLAVASFNNNSDELWLALGTGSSFRCIAIHQLAATMNSRQCATLPICHALTGCDTVSSFAGRGKKTAWEIWKL